MIRECYHDSLLVDRSNSLAFFISLYKRWFWGMEQSKFKMFVKVLQYQLAFPNQFNLQQKHKSFVILNWMILLHQKNINE